MDQLLGAGQSAKATKALYLIEAKRDSARLNVKHREQALKYGNTIGVPFVVITNGLEFELCNVVSGRKLKVNGSVIGKVPAYHRLDAILGQFKTNPMLDNVDLATDDSLPYRPGLNLPQLQSLIRRCHNTIRNVEKDEENVFADVSKLLFLKLLEEKQDRGELKFVLPYTYRFYELALKNKEPDQVKDAILSMMEQVVKLPSYGDVMTPVLNMAKPVTFQKVVAELSKANFTDSELDVRGSVFEYFVRVSLKGRRLGQFFTPRPVIRLMLSLLPLEQVIPDLLDPDKHVCIVDPACGSGGFLLVAMNTLLQKVASETGHMYSKEKAGWLKDRIMKDVLWGADANQRIASTAKMNMIIAGDGFANIRHGDSLTEEVGFLCVKNRTMPLADFVVTNPPFGMSEADTLTDADLDLFGVRLTKTQALFLQKMVGITKPSGRICTVIDEGMLNTAAMARIRKFLISECFIDAVFHLPDVTFVPNKINVRSSVLLMTRKPNEDAVQEYPIRMIDLQNVSYDSMGEEDATTPIEDIIHLVHSRWDDMASIQLSLDDTGGIFRSYPLQLSMVVAENEARLDFKYYDPAVCSFIDDLRKAGALNLEELRLKTEPIIRGKSPAKAEYNADMTSEVEVIKAGNIGKSGIVGNRDIIPENVYDRLKTAQLHRNDLLIASTGEGTLGKATVYDSDVKALADGHVTIVRLDDRISPEYGAWYLRSEFGQKQINRLFTGATGLIELPEDAARRILVLAPKDKVKQAKLVQEWVTQVQDAGMMEADAKSKREHAQSDFIGHLKQLMTFNTAT